MGQPVVRAVLTGTTPRNVLLYLSCLRYAPRKSLGREASASEQTPDPAGDCVEMLSVGLLTARCIERNVLISSAQGMRCAFLDSREVRFCR